MSNIDLIIEERAADLGNFLVGRLLPFKQKRMVGPFVFIDHMGPAVMGPNDNLDVGAHPHIGLSTLTFLFEGQVMHRDSLGNELVIKPGAVNWMTAGKGVVHSERTPDALRGIDKTMHGLQIWVALPKDKEQIEPSFEHYEADNLPKWQTNGVDFTLVAGSFGTVQSPVAVYSPLYMIELKNNTNEYKTVSIGDDLFGESGMYILEGSVRSDGETYGDKQLLIAKDAKLCSFEMTPNTSIYIFGGEPFPEERLIFWNFVSSDKNIMDKAIKDWNDDLFPKVLNETERVPLPAYFADRFKK